MQMVDVDNSIPVIVNDRAESLDLSNWDRLCTIAVCKYRRGIASHLFGYLSA